MEVVFWLSVFVAVYSYFIYPVILYCLPWREFYSLATDYSPNVTVIITAYNEADSIADKLDNTILQRYPIDIIVVSDCSGDGTDEIVSTYGNGVKLIRPTRRSGKEYCQWLAMQQAIGDVFVFTDVATRMERNAVGLLVDRLKERDVGAVSSEDNVGGAYIRYEMWLRRLESKAGGLVGLSGSLFAAKRQVCMAWDVRSPSDFNVAMNCDTHDMIAVSEPGVKGAYANITGSEYQRKVRTVLRGMTAVARHPGSLTSFRLWSHKIMRWAVPFALLGVLVTSVGLGYWWLVALQVAFYSAALVVRPVRFFITANAAIAAAFVRFIRGDRMTTWEPSKR